MSGLHSAIDEYTGEDIRADLGVRLQDDVADLVVAMERIRAEVVRRLAVLDRTRPFEVDGFRSTTSWLRSAAPVSGGEAAALVSVARSVAEKRWTIAAMQRGELSWRKARVLAEFAGRHPDAYREHEQTTVDTAIGLPDRDVAKLVDYVRQNLDPEAAVDEAEDQRARRALHASETVDGMMAINGLLDRETGAPVMTALRAMSEPAARDGDARTPAQRRADALSDLCRDWLDHGNVPIHGGERPHVNVTVDIEVLERRAPGRVELDGQVITPEAALRWACDAKICRLITKGNTQPLEVGRAARTVSSAQRRALELRDGGCRWNGCDRPSRWCDAHHIEHWIKGGPTDLDNLVLLCRHHHRFVHEHGWTIEMRNGDVRIHAPPQDEAV